MKSFYVRSTDATHIKTLKVTTTTLCISRLITQIGAHELKLSSNFSCHLYCSWKFWPTWLLKQTSPLFWGNFRFVYTVTASDRLQLSKISPTDSYIYFSVIIVLDFRPMWRVRTKRSRQPPSRPSAGAPLTSPRWRTLVSTAWCSCCPTETVNHLSGL